MDLGFWFYAMLENVSTVLCFGIIGWTLVAMTRAWRGKASPASLPSGSHPMLESRMERMEQATAAIAQQVERIAEGRRFVSDVLAEKKAPQAR